MSVETRWNLWSALFGVAISGGNLWTDWLMYFQANLSQLGSPDESPARRDGSWLPLHQQQAFCGGSRCCREIQWPRTLHNGGVIQFSRVTLETRSPVLSVPVCYGPFRYASHWHETKEKESIISWGGKDCGQWEAATLSAWRSIYGWRNSILRHEERWLQAGKSGSWWPMQSSFMRKCLMGNRQH